jgi:aspartate/methionine/tyrosine aminotransferase
MARPRPARLNDIAGIGVDRTAAIADVQPYRDYLRLENLDTDILPDPQALEETRTAVARDADNSYLPFIGKLRLRNAAAAHVSSVSGIGYSGERNCVITAGGLSGILNVLLATIDTGDEVLLTDPIYVGLINRVRLAGGVPRFVPLQFRPAEPWSLDRGSLQTSINSKTRAMLLMSPSMPTGAVLDHDDWKLVAELCVKHDLLLILDSAMERLLFEGASVEHPAALPGMAERTITVGSCAKELRMIGWRVGWIVAPEEYMPDTIAVSLANVVVPVGIAQEAVAVALEQSSATLADYIRELQHRRDTVMQQLEGLPFGVPLGGWSMLLRVSDLGMDGETASARLLSEGVCATGMQGWGGILSAQYIRFVYANEPVQRLKDLGRRVRAALKIG